MFYRTSQALAENFYTMLEYRLKTSGVEYPKHHLLGGVMINTMALLLQLSKGIQTKLGHTLMRQVIAVSDEVMTLCFLSDIDVTFPLAQHQIHAQEIPLNILVDGNIIGFDIPALYFNSKSVDEDLLFQAQVLFNFLALVRLFIVQLGEIGVSELIQDFNNTIRAETLLNRTRSTETDAGDTIRTTGTGARKVIPRSRSAGPLVAVLGARDMNTHGRRRHKHLPAVAALAAMGLSEAILSKQLQQQGLKQAKRRGRLMRAMDHPSLPCTQSKQLLQRILTRIYSNYIPFAHIDLACLTRMTYGACFMTTQPSSGRTGPWSGTRSHVSQRIAKLVFAIDDLYPIWPRQFANGSSLSHRRVRHS
ncbi:hypothetical protein AG1IA_08960 [Rhizoctonia solani AG-1 IA]|uniref:Uncharacterized protein n=1 Tax=Thanatephorus cucumeris (strain AG1-IA) TaxID=983506 RepID=L8WFQ6_THACA|nr:hypothetical protein AG1IA_08960 [Rhizoctonia solani AG-1 IA]